MSLSRLFQDSLEPTYDLIRQNWSINSALSEQEYENVWKDWQEKFYPMDSYSEYTDFEIDYHTLRCFIESKPVGSFPHVKYVQDNELVLTGLDRKQRFFLHELCTNLGLHHQSLGQGKNRNLHVYKPNPWLWEYSQPNPYIRQGQSVSQEEHKAKAKEEKKKFIDQMLSEETCCECGLNGHMIHLFYCLHYGEVYCEDCAQLETDSQGRCPWAYKMESIYEFV